MTRLFYAVSCTIKLHCKSTTKYDMAGSFAVLSVLLFFLPVLVTCVPTARPVAIALYYESLCPGCRDFIKTQLYPTYQKVASIMDITLVPYGNADEYRDGQEWKFTCQHGPAECVGNLIETCAISLLVNTSSYFPFIHCIETSIGQSPAHTAEVCAKQLGIDFAPIEKCASGSQGNELEHEMALKTNALRPRHQYVPWVTMNGKHSEEIQNRATSNLLKLVCDNYRGNKPAACQE